MVKLTGYLEGEFAATFELRLPSKDPYALLYFSGETWEQQSLSEHQALQVEAKGPNGLIVGGNVEYYVLFERVPEIRRRHHVKAVRLSG